MREVKAAARVVVVSVVVSALAGVVWGFLAPAEHLLVVVENQGAALTGESAHQFDSVAIFVGIAALLGLVAAVGCWQWRSLRGPTLFAGLLIGAAAGTAAMAGVGELVAQLRYPRPESAAVNTIVAVAPGIGTLLVLIVQPLVASFVFLAVASVNPLDDLGSTRARFTPTGPGEPRTGGEPVLS